MLAFLAFPALSAAKACALPGRPPGLPWLSPPSTYERVFQQPARIQSLTESAEGNGLACPWGIPLPDEDRPTGFFSILRVGPWTLAPVSLPRKGLAAAPG